MLRLSAEQCAALAERENDYAAAEAARRLKRRFPGISEDESTLTARLRAALAYALRLPLRTVKARRDFLLLETFYPGFYRQPEVDAWLKRPDGYSADQRLNDLKQVIINRERRKQG